MGITALGQSNGPLSNGQGSGIKDRLSLSVAKCRVMRQTDATVRQILDNLRERARGVWRKETPLAQPKGLLRI